MGNASEIIECVPNVSEGRDRLLIDRLAESIRRVHGVSLADIHVDPDHHRSVFTFLGAPPAVEAAALTLAEEALASIDMSRHRGVHPRIGALDVLPFIPLRSLTMADAVTIARRIGRSLAERLDLPVYFYGEAAGVESRRRLADIRRGEYEGLELKLADPSWAPDAGHARFNPKSGATAVGARGILVAFNVWLDSDDLEVARAIARAIRKSSGGAPKAGREINDGAPGLQAMGVRLAGRGIVQVSMNLLDYRLTSLPRAFDLVQSEAAGRGVSIKQSELVGLAPREAFQGRSPESLGLADFTPLKLLETHLPAE
jgi:glutamate formiminotransferase